MQNFYRTSWVFTLLLGTLFLFTACKSDGERPIGDPTEVPSDESEDTLDMLVSWMAGHFDSSEQAAKDSTYYDITLIMEPIWEGNDSVRYFYVEQSVTDSEKPYRQRVYQVQRESEDVFRSDIYLLDNDSLYIGAWKDKSIFDKITIDDVKIKEGCSVYLKYDGKSFSGSTIEGDCISNFRGAAYATSEVTVTENVMTSWDRGFGADTAQVWGAEKGAYIFKKTSSTH